ncbi:MAG: ribbon-helix-helix domain-containing protein [Hyphomicrobiaceae bacterium]
MPRPVKISLTIGGHRTSISLEKDFSDELKAMAKGEGISVAKLVRRIDQERPENDGLSSAVRVAVLRHALRKRL